MKFEYGEEAIILSTKMLELNSAGEKKFEVTAGIDKIKRVDSEEEIKETLPRKKQNIDSELKKLTEKIYGMADTYTEPRETKTATSHDAISENKISQIDLIYENLINNDVESPLAKKIIKQLKNYTGLTNSDDLENYALSALSSIIPTASFEVVKGNKPKVIALVGPTGVGKTTCIAKLAVISKLLHNLDIGLISIDTYRLGALDQLKIFSEVSEIDFHVAYEPSDLAKIYTKLKNKDLIFVDTVGRSQKNSQLLKGISDFLSAIKVDETYLVLSATTTTKNLSDIASKFRPLNYNGLIFTKLDEAVSFGNILNLVSGSSVPVKYLTNGQVIPDDIIAADPEFIANMVYSGLIE